MKTSIKISVAIILVVIFMSLYHGAHGYITGFDAVIFIGIFGIGGVLGKESTPTKKAIPSKMVKTREVSIVYGEPIPGISDIHNDEVDNMIGISHRKRGES